MSHAPTFLTCSALSFAWPDGTTVFDGFQLAVGSGRTGLIGLNGSGKSTLLRLLAGELTPSTGTVKTAGDIGYLPQTVVLDTGLRVDEALGIAATRAGLLAIEVGDTSEEHFTAVGDDWDVEERARATLDQLGLGHIGLDRTIGEMSGGECVLLRLATLLLARPDILLLDEPTNNLDLVARERLYAAVDSWSGVMVVVSHDRALLERVDQIADLRDGEVRWYGGAHSAYEEALAQEQEAAERMVRVAEADVHRQKRELSDAQVKLARRARYGQKMYDTKREPRIVMNARKRAAQESAGKHRILHTEKLAEAKERLDEAVEAVRDDSLSVVENVARFAPGATNNAIRARLARFLFRGASADRPAGTLSGGERFRASLAALLLAEPAPQLLLLDEPTNSLDLASVRRLTAALEAYEGALIVASHDVPFLDSIGITRRLTL
ncbi:ATP-binding cassette domain-containing protein [Streptosporangium lutulentum]|uniref:ATPase subunit of ABC transporter with duplicated ATPase domains n=1 Tax=Streptosporangium lutulentum TaxID=1461250 RepID=A0ABT9QAX8_9ACTN|nr:ATP-binding cassette domain-containing protein [Streptosporangium lutulentum]MDP9843915.1 ATPase subunit of ABC transporter with duplicated ATPase domains [Streptosporangium lutulentum]